MIFVKCLWECKLLLVKAVATFQGTTSTFIDCSCFGGTSIYYYFDEATSALDNRTQAIVTESLNKLRATRIIVAHRLSTIRNADRILVLDNGTIAEEGNFEKLVAQNGIFAKLVKRQLV